MQLPLDKRVFMTLFFLRHYPVYVLLGFLFDLHKSNSYRNVEMMKGFISKFLPLPESVREKKMSSFEELLKEVKGIELLIDIKEKKKANAQRQAKKNFFA